MKSELLWDAMGHIDESRIEEVLCQTEDRLAGKTRKKSRLKKGIASAAAAALVIMVGTPLPVSYTHLFQQIIFSTDKNE